MDWPRGLWAGLYWPRSCRRREWRSASAGRTLSVGWREASVWSGTWWTLGCWWVSRGTPRCRGTGAAWSTTRCRRLPHSSALQYTPSTITPLTPRATPRDSHHSHRASVSGLLRPFLSFGFYPLNLHSKQPTLGWTFIATIKYKLKLQQLH